jgi:hypothetical protein
MGFADLAEEDGVVSVDEDGGGIGGLVGCVPAEAVLIGDFVVGVGDEVDVGRQGFCLARAS